MDNNACACGKRTTSRCLDCGARICETCELEHLDACDEHFAERFGPYAVAKAAKWREAHAAGIPEYEATPEDVVAAVESFEKYRIACVEVEIRKSHFRQACVEKRLGVHMGRVRQCEAEREKVKGERRELKQQLSALRNTSR